MELDSCPWVSPLLPGHPGHPSGSWKQGFCPRPEAPDLSPYPVPASPEFSKLVNEIGGGRVGRVTVLLILLIRPSLHSPRHGQHLNAAGEAGRRVEGTGEREIAQNLDSWSVLFPALPYSGLSQRLGFRENKSGGTLG